RGQDLALPFNIPTKSSLQTAMLEKLKVPVLKRRLKISAKLQKDARVLRLHNDDVIRCYGNTLNH
ncbi:MAG: hypothetical protein MJE68_29920, partial [Proteobacteria bacterium]|nr:hypothetical protein [Pseudomonadota bacterium]